ncbi:hypothetical protein D3C85_1619250 [compost metagenome]
MHIAEQLQSPWQNGDQHTKRDLGLRRQDIHGAQYHANGQIYRQARHDLLKQQISLRYLEI